MMKLALIMLLLCFASLSYASVAVCPTSSPGSSFSSFGSSSLTNGCSQADKTFSLFNVANASCAANAGCTTSTASNTDIFGSGSIGSGSSAGFAGTVTANLNGGSPTVMVLNVIGTTATDTANLTYAVQANVGNPANAALKWFIGGNIGLAPTGSIVVGATGGQTEFIRVVETFCVDATTVTGCPAADTGTMTGTITVNGTSTGTFSTFVFSNCSAGSLAGTCNGGPSASSIALFGFHSALAVSDVFTLSRVSGNQSTLTLNNIGNSFGEYAEAPLFIPEPSTFLLTGFALAGLAVLRRLWL